MSLLITRISFFHRLRATSEDVFEETPMRSTAQEILTHGNKCNEVRDGVWSEVVELSPEEVQKDTKERMGRQREPTVDMSGEENTLTLQRPRLGLVPREPR